MISYGCMKPAVMDRPILVRTDGSIYVAIVGYVGMKPVSIRQIKNICHLLKVKFIFSKIQPLLGVETLHI